MADKPGVLVVGDVMLDVVAQAPYAGRGADLNYSEASVALCPGGTGFNLALAMAAEGYAPVHLLCSPGSGPASVMVLDQLAAAGVRTIANQASGTTTGTAVISYAADGTRIMLADPGANSAPLEPDAIASAIAGLAAVRGLVVSGYMLFRSSTRPGVLEIMEAAKRSECVVVLDLVPHSIHRQTSPRDFRALLVSVDYVSGESNTLDALSRPGRWQDLLAEVSGLCAYESSGRCVLVHREEAAAERFFPLPDQPTAMRGLTDRLLAAILSERWLVS